MSEVTTAVLRRTWAVRLLQVVFGAAVLGIWQLLVSTGTVKVYVLASPVQVVKSLHSLFAHAQIWHDILATVEVTAVGLVIGILVGTLLGVLSGTVPIVGYYLRPFMIFLNAVPRLVLIPIFIVWTGFGFETQTIVVVLVIVFLIAVTVESGVREISGDLVKNAQVLGASWPQLMRTVFLPGVGIWIVSVSRQSVGHAFAAAVVAEFFGAPKGLGALVNSGQASFDTPAIYAAIVITAVLALIADQLLRIVDRRVGRYLPQ